MNAGIRGRVPRAGKWSTAKFFKGVGSGNKEALDETTVLILDEFRRLEIVRKARTMHLYALTATIIGSACILVVAHLTQPILYPYVEHSDCPIGNSFERCSSHGICMNGNAPVAGGTNCTGQCYCKCNLERIGEACEHFDVGMPFSLFCIFAFMMQSIASLVKSHCGNISKRVIEGK